MLSDVFLFVHAQPVYLVIVASGVVVLGFCCWCGCTLRANPTSKGMGDTSRRMEVWLGTSAAGVILKAVPIKSEVISFLVYNPFDALLMTRSVSSHHIRPPNSCMPETQSHSTTLERSTQYSNPNLLRMIHRQHIRNRLIRPRQIITHINMIPNLQENDRGRNNKRRPQQRPVTDKLLLVGEFPCIEVIHDGRAAGLDALVETDVVG